MNLNTMNPLQRAIGMVMFVVGFVWMLLGLGFVSGSVMSGQTWAAILGFAVLAGGLFVLTRKPKAAEPPSDGAAPPQASDDADPS
ncbi:MAG: LPXTG cell wall anchor domain-containing protein [Actinomycetes bacterium]